MVTLKDVARECGVSFSTVSKALKGSHEISEEKMRFIREKAESMGYRPNIAARTLRTNRTNDVAIIFEDKTGSGIQHQYFGKILGAIQNAFQEKEYEITFIGRNNAQNFDYLNHILSRNFDGVVILATDFSRKNIQTILKSEVPTVCLDYYFDEKHACVLSDNETAMKTLVEYVVSRGHKKVAMIHGEKTEVTQKRIEVFRQEMSRNGLKIPENYFMEGLYHDPETSAEATAVLLDLPDPPTCIFYPDDYSVLGGIRELNVRNLKPGKDISIVGFDGIMLSSMMIPALTTYEQDGTKIGRMLAEKLISQIEGGEDYSRCDTVSGRILTGGTVAEL